MMSNRLELRGRRGGRTDMQFTIHLTRVGAEYLGVEHLRQRYAYIRLSGSRRAREDQDRQFLLSLFCQIDDPIR